MIEYSNNLESINEDQLSGFFVSWPNPPSEKTFLKLLKNSYKVIMAKDQGRVIGFITAISDGVLSAYIPLLEVLPDYQGRGIGHELVLRMKEELSHLYMIDLICDEGLISYYEKLGMTKATGVMIRNYQKQNACLD